MIHLFSNLTAPSTRSDRGQEVLRAHSLKFAARRNDMELPDSTLHRSREQFSPSNDEWTSSHESPKDPYHQELLYCVEQLTETPKPPLSSFSVAALQDTADDLLKYLDLDITTFFQDIETPCPDAPLPSTNLTTLQESPNNPFASTTSLNSSSAGNSSSSARKPISYAEYQKRWVTERAKTLLGPDATRADYDRNMREKRAKALLGPDATRADYNYYTKAVREGKLPKNATAEQYWQYRSTMPTRRKKANLPTPSAPPKSDS